MQNQCNIYCLNKIKLLNTHVFAFLIYKTFIETVYLLHDNCVFIKPQLDLNADNRGMPVNGFVTVLKYIKKTIANKCSRV